MRPSLVTPALVLITSFISSSTALEALAGSPCAVQCGNVLSSTSGSDMACTNADFSGTLAGTTFQSCITCQISSTYVDPVTKQTDLQWALYNLRYAISWCLYGYPNNTAVGNTPCITSTACGPLANAFEFDSLSTNASAYGYCALLTNVQLPKCTACLAVQSAEFYLTNFVTALSAACVQQPTAGQTISIQGSLFSTNTVNITSPSSIPTSSYSPSTGQLTLGAKIGIAVGAVLVLLIVVGFCIIWTGKRRRRRVLRERQRQSGYDDWRKHHNFAEDGMDRGRDPVVGGTPPMKDGANKTGDFFDSPDSQRPLHPWASSFRDDDSPASAAGEKVYFSPYTSQYNSPVSATDAVQVIGREWPTEKRKESPLQTGREWPMDRKGSFGHSSNRVRSRSREKGGDRIEMQNVAPVLLHPGPGRGPLPPTGGLTEDDARRGDAV